jgi:tetratricopeptide (TPR) repeat protein
MSALSIATDRRGRHPLSPRPRPLAFVLAALAVAVASFAFSTRTPPTPDPIGVGAVPEVRLPADAVADARPLDEIDAAIGVWTANLDAEPADFIAAVHLGELYLARTRLSGDLADGTRAANAADRALAIDASLLAARLLHAQAAHAAHDFRAAEADALAVLADAPDAPEALAVLGDARLELGSYDLAADAYARLAELASAPAVDARLARLDAMTGRLDEGRRLAADATSAALDIDQPTALAWYHGLEAALAFQAGDLVTAESQWREALSLWDGSAAAHAGLGRTLAARGDLAAARISLERAVAIQPQPDALALLIEVQARVGDAAAAAISRDTLLALGELGSADRQLARFLADRGEDPERAIALARADLAVRGDVHAHDTLAWALLAAGDVDAAESEMQRALAVGTEDALLDYHAGMIAAAAGRTADAMALLEAALERNPGFDLAGADRARTTLASLRVEDRP